jgi:hypothetical protein
VNISERDRRALLLLGAGVVVAAVLHFAFPASDASSGTASGSAVSGSVEMAHARLERLRRIAATLSAREAVMKQVSLDLADRERSLIDAATLGQAQAALIEAIHRVGAREQIDIRGGDLGAPRSFGDYGLVYATVTFTCHIEQLVNFLADLGREPQAIVPAEQRISPSGKPQEKNISVRMVLAAPVAKKLLPEKKGIF